MVLIAMNKKKRKDTEKKRTLPMKIDWNAVDRTFRALEMSDEGYNDLYIIAATSVYVGGE